MLSGLAKSSRSIWPKKGRKTQSSSWGLTLSSRLSWGTKSQRQFPASRVAPIPSSERKETYTAAMMPEYPAVTRGPSCRGHLLSRGLRTTRTHIFSASCSPSAPVRPVLQIMRFTGFLMVKPKFGKKKKKSMTFGVWILDTIFFC